MNITSEPNPVVNLSISVSTSSESNTTTFTITAIADSAVEGSQTVDLALSGTVSNDDFDGNIPTTISIEDGETAGTIEVVITNDNLEEDEETVIFTISNPSNGITLGDTTSVSAILMIDRDQSSGDITSVSAIVEAGDDDQSSSVPAVNLSISVSTASESNTTSLTIIATADSAVEGTQTVDLDLSGIASSDDFDGNIPSTITIEDGETSGTIEVVVRDDNLEEDEETATFTISNPSNGITLGDTTSVSAIIEASDGDQSSSVPAVNLSISLSNASESNSSTFIITATAEGTVEGSQTVDVDLSGIASSDDFDGNIPSTITIEDGETSGTIEVVVRDDNLEEDEETATFTISNPSNGITLGDNISVSANIEASDPIEREDINLGDDGVTEDFSFETNALNIRAGIGDDNINSGSGDDIIDAGGGQNTVDAGAGNDVIVGSGQADIDNQIDGGEGTDKVKYAGVRADFSVALFANGTVRVGSNTDTLTNVEQLQFTDQSILVEDLPTITLDDTLIRFRNSDVPTGTYLFTGSEEAETIGEDFSPPFVAEGEAFNVSLEEKDGLVQFNRFRNKQLEGTYLYANEEESESILENFSEVFELEGTAFYAYGADYGVGQDVIRFRNINNSTYIFALEEEAQSIRDNFSDVFAEEGPAFEV